MTLLCEPALPFARATLPLSTGWFLRVRRSRTAIACASQDLFAHAASVCAYWRPCSRAPCAGGHSIRTVPAAFWCGRWKERKNEEEKAARHHLQQLEQREEDSCLGGNTDAELWNPNQTKPTRGGAKDECACVTSFVLCPLSFLALSTHHSHPFCQPWPSSSSSQENGFEGGFSRARPRGRAGREPPWISCHYARQPLSCIRLKQ